MSVKNRKPKNGDLVLYQERLKNVSSLTNVEQIEQLYLVLEIEVSQASFRMKLLSLPENSTYQSSWLDMTSFNKLFTILNS